MSMPILKRLEPARTNNIPIKPIFKDESMASNNIQILEDIFLRQFQLKEDDPVHRDNIRLIYGDLKTWSRIQSVKELRRDISQEPFDRFDFLLPSLGFWHLRFNLLQVIHDIHFGKAGPADPSTLQYAADRWGRSRVVQPNDFQALGDPIIQSYQSRVIGIWIRLLRQEKLNVQRIESPVPWLSAQLPGKSGSWIKKLKVISRELRDPWPTTTRDRMPPLCDQQFENHQNFCAHVESYLTLRYAIKHADIGLLRHALRHVTLIFQARVASTPKYAQALLYTLHTVDSPASSDRLQEAILMNGLVNLRGAEDSHFETDRLLELLNNNLKVFQQERSYFSKNSDQLLENWSLNSPFLLALKGVIETTFGKPNSPRHPAKSAAEDVWSMALNLAHKSLSRQTHDRFSLNPTVNLHMAGLEGLSGNILKYNEQYLPGWTPMEDTEAGTDGIDQPMPAMPAGAPLNSPILSTALFDSIGNAGP